VIHLDTSFLVDLKREVAHERPGPAFEVMESLDTNELLSVSVFVICELRAGAEVYKQPLKEHEALDELLAGMLVAYPDQRFAPAYGRLWAATNGQRRSVAEMDLLIGTAALLDDAPLVTKNVKDFSRVPGLRVLSY
jgi:predicted nucleic acid-binding protein